MMVKPRSFGFNPETAESNSFQNNAVEKSTVENAITEFDTMFSKLREHNIDVHKFDDIEDELPDSVFPNNWISHIPGKAIVIYPMLTANRQKEVREDIIDWTIKELAAEDKIDLRKANGVLEGTGSIVFDHTSKTAFAAISPRTSLSLLRRLCEQIGYATVSFESVDLTGGQIYHTNVMMGIADNYAVVCLESIPDPIERHMLKNKLIACKKEIVEISYAQMNAFAGNVIEVLCNDGKSYLLMSKTAKDALSADQCSRIEAYSKILDFEIPTIEKIGGGSVRCMLAGFFNYPK